MNNNGKKLLDKMSDVDPKLIEGAEKKPFKKRNLFIGLTSGMATVAAAAVIAVAAVNTPTQLPPIDDSNSVSSTNSGSGTNSTQVPPEVKDPPVLDFSKYKDLPKITDGDYGVNGFGEAEEKSLNYSELEIGSPWKGAVLETMPVYMSHSTDINIDLDKMYARVREVASALGISEDSLEITDNYYDMSSSIEKQLKLGEEAGASEEEIADVINRMVRQMMSQVHVEGKADGVSISVNTAFRTYIKFDEPIKLPDGYNLTESATAEEKAAVLSYLSDKYKELIPYGKPVPGDGLPNKSGGFSVYDADCDLTQQIVNYWINSTCFIEKYTQTGELFGFDIYSDGSCEKLGDYPILTAAQAEEILKSNKYDDKSRMPADAKILKTDIVYNNHAGSTAVMPYYKFYVETDKETFFDKEVTCDVYTIAAVPEEFIEIETGDYGVYA